MLLRHGVAEQLDGIWAMAPRWTVALGEAAERGEWDKAAEYQQLLTGVKNLVETYGFRAFTSIVNARGIPGNRGRGSRYPRGKRRGRRTWSVPDRPGSQLPRSQ